MTKTTVRISDDEVMEILESEILTGKNAHMTFKEKFLKDFDAGDKNECWEYKGGFTSNDYGKFYARNRHMLAHRVSYLIHYGHVGDMLVCHKCDNHKCVNPNHLFLGTAKDNIIDMINKKRNNPAYGERCGMSKLTKKDVVKIKSLKENGWSNKKIAKHYPVTETQISRITAGTRWGHLQ